MALARALSKLGLASRTEAEALIRDERVRVDGRVVRDPRAAVVPERARVQIDGRDAPRALWRTIVFYKPRGVMTTTRDPEGRTTVYDVLGDAGKGVMPVGRLDLASSGLLILTSDTRLAAWLTDPRHAVPRTYVVSVRGAVTAETVAALTAGRVVDGERLAAARVEVRKRSRRETHLVVTLTEGRNREIRRLFAACGHDVTRLKRVAFGALTLESLSPGGWRPLTADEVLSAFPGAPLTSSARRQSPRSDPDRR